MSTPTPTPPPRPATCLSPSPPEPPAEPVTWVSAAVYVARMRAEEGA